MHLLLKFKGYISMFKKIATGGSLTASNLSFVDDSESLPIEGMQAEAIFITLTKFYQEHRNQHISSLFEEATGNFSLPVAGLSI